MRGVIENGCPTIECKIAGKVWKAVVDTGFNSDLELPSELFDHVVMRFKYEGSSTLAAGVTTTQDYYIVRLPFDGEAAEALATFVETDTILIGTGLLKNYILHIDFPAGTVTLERQ